MKSTLVFSLMVLLFSIGAKATDIPIFKDPLPGGTVPQSLTLIYPVSATIDETDLAVYFDWSVDTATITVYDASNQIVDQEVVNTNTTIEIFIPVVFWGSGAYTLKVTYGTTNLIGYFDIP